MKMSLGSEKTFFLHGADGLGAEFQRNFFAIDNHSLGLEVWLPDFLGVALRKADVVAVLLTFAGDVTLLHVVILIVTRYSAYYSTLTPCLSQ
jgi:hypothetical protein